MRRRPFHFARAPSAPIGLIADATTRRTQQGAAAFIDVVEHPRRALRRIPPDPIQFQVILGSLLGDGRLVGAEGERLLRIAHEPKRAEYVRWKYQRLGAFAGDAPRQAGGHLTFETVAHPVFEDLAPFFCQPGGARHVRRDDVLPLVRPLGLAVWLTDLGRLELRAEAFLPEQRRLALAS